MRYSFGSSSERRLSECHEDIQLVLRKAIQVIDFSIICGHRTKEDQDLAYRTGRSKVMWPNSKHNQMPSLAVDIAPFPIDWENTDRFYYLAGICLGIGSALGIRLRHGGDWDMDGDISDNGFNDLPHLELI